MKKLALAITSIISCGAVSYAANADVYFGGKLGYAALDNHCVTGDTCDGESIGLGLHLGRQFTEYLGLEVGFDYLGSLSASGVKNGNAHYVDHDFWGALSLAPRLTIPMTDNLQLFTKIGAAHMSAGRQSDIAATASVGMEYKLDYNWSLRTEFQHYNHLSDGIIDNINANFFSLGFNYKLGAEPVNHVVEEKSPVEQRPMPRIVETVYPAQVSNIQFESSSAEVSNTDAVEPMLKIVKKHPQSTLEITGFADSTGSDAYNQTLSEQRAQATAELFMENGIEIDRITIDAFGEDHPVADNSTSEGRALNRRVEIVIPAFQYNNVSQ